MEGAKEKRLSVEEVDTALFTDDQDELLSVLKKAEGVSRLSVKKGKRMQSKRGNGNSDCR